MPLSFNPNTPGASQVVSVTQAPIQQNFQSLDSAFNSPVGGVTGGGNLSSYSIQNTITSFVSKPVNPIGVFHTISSANGNPELAWINNINSIGSGPYTGTRITGGGITSAVWGLITSNAGVATVSASYNIASVSVTGVNGTVTVNFSRNFTSASYAVLLTAAGFNDSTIRKLTITAQTVSSFSFKAVTSSGATEVGVCSLVLFGTLV